MRSLLRHFLPVLFLAFAACDQQPVGIPVGRADLPWHTLTEFPEYCEAGPVWASSADDVYLAYVTSTDRNHSLLHFDGTSWQPVELPRRVVTGIWGSRPTDVYVAIGGELQHFDGATWTIVPEVQPGWWVTGSASNTVYAGNGSDVYYFDGTAWEHLLTSSIISAFWAGPGTTALASKSRGVGVDSLLWWDGAEWSRTEFPGRVFAFWGEAAGHIVAVGVDTLSNTAIWTSNGSVWNAETVPAHLPRLRDVAGSGPDNIFAAGDDGTLLHFNGAAWTVADVPTRQDFDYVWTYGPGSGYVTGREGAVLASDGAAWVNTFGYPVNALGPIWAENENTLILGSAHDEINVFENGAWHHEIIEKYGRLSAIDGRSRNDLYAAMDYSGIYHYDGLNWTSVLDSAHVTAMHVLSNGEVCAVDYSESLILFDRSTWTRVTLPLNSSGRNAVWASAVDDVWMILRGSVAQYDGDTTHVFTELGGDNYDVCGNGPNDVFIVGWQGITHFDGKTFQKVGPRQRFDAVVTSNGRVFAAGLTQAYFDRGFWHQVLEPSQQIRFLITAVDGSVVALATRDGDTIEIQRLRAGDW